MKHLVGLAITLGSFLCINTVYASEPKPTTPAKEYVAMGPTMIHGIDVSKYQGNIDWADVKEHGVDFTFIKATEGVTIKDPMYLRNLHGAKAAGVHVSAYHFFRFHVSPREQVKHFLSQVDVKQLDLAPVLDIEENRTNSRRSNTETVRNNIRKFLKEFEKHHKVKMILYTNEVGYRKYIKGHFDDYPLWICSLKDYVGATDKYHIWQYSHSGRVKGIRHAVDLNRFAGSHLDWLGLMINRDYSEVIGRTPIKQIEKPAPKVHDSWQVDPSQILGSVSFER